MHGAFRGAERLAPPRRRRTVRPALPRAEPLAYYCASSNWYATDHSTFDRSLYLAHWRAPALGSRLRVRVHAGSQVARPRRGNHAPRAGRSAQRKSELRKLYCRDAEPLGIASRLCQLERGRRCSSRASPPHLDAGGGLRSFAGRFQPGVGDSHDSTTGACAVACLVGYADRFFARGSAATPEYRCRANRSPPRPLSTSVPFDSLTIHLQQVPMTDTAQPPALASTAPASTTPVSRQRR